jgi:hypothetical protein
MSPRQGRDKVEIDNLETAIDAAISACDGDWCAH